MALSASARSEGKHISIITPLHADAEPEANGSKNAATTP